MSSSNASIVLTNLSFNWPDGEPALAGVTGSFTSGRTGLVGANGAGKPTLLRLIAGELAPTSGMPTQAARTLGKHFPELTKPWHAQSGPRFMPPRANEVFFWVTAERAAQLKRLPG